MPHIIRFISHKIPFISRLHSLVTKRAPKFKCTGRPLGEDPQILFLRKEESAARSWTVTNYDSE